MIDWAIDQAHWTLFFFHHLQFCLSDAVVGPWFPLRPPLIPRYSFSSIYLSLRICNKIMTHQFLSKRRAPVLFHFWPSCLRFSVLHLHDCPHNTLSVHHEHRAYQVRSFTRNRSTVQPPHVLPVGLKWISPQKALCSFPRCSVVW